MRFEASIDPDKRPNSRLVYRVDEYSFDVEPTPSGSYTSVLINDLNLEVDRNGKVISVWGMSPYISWIDAPLSPPIAQIGEVKFIPDTPISQGISVQLNKRKKFPIYFDRTSGWIRIQDDRIPSISIKILNGVVFELDDEGNFCSLWLNPHQEGAIK